MSSILSSSPAAQQTAALHLMTCPSVDIAEFVAGEWLVVNEIISVLFLEIQVFYKERKPQWEIPTRSKGQTGV